MKRKTATATLIKGGVLLAICEVSLLGVGIASYLIPPQSKTTQAVQFAVGAIKEVSPYFSLDTARTTNGQGVVFPYCSSGLFDGENTISPSGVLRAYFVFNTKSLSTNVFTNASSLGLSLSLTTSSTDTLGLLAYATVDSFASTHTAGPTYSETPTSQTNGTISAHSAPATLDFANEFSTARSSSSDYNLYLKVSYTFNFSTLSFYQSNVYSVLKATSFVFEVVFNAN